MESRFIQVLEICLPVFAVIGLGKILQWQRVIGTDQRHFINRLVYNFSLPALIFCGVAGQRLDHLFNVSLLVGALLPIAVVATLFIALSKIFNYTKGYAAAFIFGSFWANVSYMGFPLARNSFGEAGYAAASVYNAFAMPVFVILGFSVIGWFCGKEKGHGVGSILKKALINPIVSAAFLGVCAAGIASLLRQPDDTLALPTGLPLFIQLAKKTLMMIGTMGLPLALLSVGAALQLKHTRGNALPLVMVCTGKLVLVPLFSFLTFRFLLPATGADVDPAIMGTTVLLSATPNAVASYVVACDIGVEEGFVSTMLVLTTSLSIIAIPLWLLVVL
ncbi:MAG: AEC family transporter [Lentisphaeria bacterium]|nr:AEC family transporter [Lentisphaeria bacterium]